MELRSKNAIALKAKFDGANIVRTPLKVLFFFFFGCGAVGALARESRE